MLKIFPALALLWAAVAAPGADAPATFKVGEFTFTRPAKWEWIQSTQSAVKAHLKLGVDTLWGSTDVKFIHEPPRPDGRKGTKADREFHLLVGDESDARLAAAGKIVPGRHPRRPKVERIVRGHKVFFVDTRPASEIGKPRPPVNHKNMGRGLYAFMESGQGNIFISLIGVTDLVDDSEAEFIKMIESAAAGK